MKVLLDENLLHDFRHFSTGHEVLTVAYMGWSGLENGKLLSKAAEAGFDVVVTLDAGIEYQQNLIELPTAVVILQSKSNALEAIRPLVPALLGALESLTPRTLVLIPD